MKPLKSITGLAVAYGLFAASGSAASPPYSPWMTGPNQARQGQVVTYNLYIRNNQDRPLTVVASLTAELNSGTDAVELALVPHIIATNAPFPKPFGCKCLGDSWKVKLGSHATAKYYFRVQLAAITSYQLNAHMGTGTYILNAHKKTIIK